MVGRPRPEPEALARQGGLATLAGARNAAASQGLHRLREPRRQGELPRLDLRLPALGPASAPPLPGGAGWISVAEGCSLRSRSLPTRIRSWPLRPPRSEER